MDPKAREGSVLKGKWRLDALLGVGGMGSVYAATNLLTETAVAVKILEVSADVLRKFKDQAQRIEYVEALRLRFKREGFLGNRVRHPGIVQVFDCDEGESGVPFLLMELLEGETLDHRWERSGRLLAPMDVLPIFEEVLEVLSAMHEKGVIHRDIKPENIFLCADGRIKVLDLGIALHTSITKLTTPGTVLGTWDFMSPEQARGQDVSASTDLYAVGASLFQMLSGRPVHAANSLAELVTKVISEPARSIATVAPTTPQPVVTLVDRALLRSAVDRWPNARDMQQALRASIRILKTHQTPPEVIAEILHRQHIADAIKQLDERIMSGIGKHVDSIRSNLADQRAMVERAVAASETVARSAISAAQGSEAVGANVDVALNKHGVILSETAERLAKGMAKVVELAHSPGRTASKPSSSPYLLPLATVACLFLGSSGGYLWARQSGTLPPPDTSAANGVDAEAPSTVPALLTATQGPSSSLMPPAIGRHPSGPTPSSTCFNAECSRAIQLSMGGGHACALTDDGSVWCWGSNNDGELGTGALAPSQSPQKVVGLSNARIVAAGGTHTCAAMTAANSVQCWGSNLYGQLGDGTTDQRLTPVAATNVGTQSISILGAGYAHTCIARASASMKCWGSNLYGELGDGTTTYRNAPTEIKGLTNVARMSLGRNRTCIRKDKERSAWCWGALHTYMAPPRPLPLGSTGRSRLSAPTKAFKDTTAPESILSLSGSLDISLGDQQLCTIKEGRVAWCWTPYEDLAASSVDGIADLTEIAVGSAHACARKADGSVWCWGVNTSGQLGKGKIDPVEDTWGAVRVIGLSNVAEIAAAGNSSCARTNEGSISCWGAVLGDPKKSNPSPVQVVP